MPQSRYDDLIESYAEKYAVSVDLIHAVCYVESRYNAIAVSSQGAIGVMQILPETGEWIASLLDMPDYSTNRLYEPEINIQLGIFYLSYLFARFDEEWCVIAAYNAGEGRVKEWLRDGVELDTIPFPETKNYVRKVMRAMRLYGNKKVLSFY